MTRRERIAAASLALAVGAPCADPWAVARALLRERPCAGGCWEDGAVLRRCRAVLPSGDAPWHGGSASWLADVLRYAHRLREARVRLTEYVARRPVLVPGQARRVRRRMLAEVQTCLLWCTRENARSALAVALAKVRP